MDIDIGDPAVFAKEKEEYERAQKFLDKMGPSYGLSQNIKVSEHMNNLI